jgi:signal transduction histidine kinase
MFGGVATGLARWLAVDLVLMRVAFVLLAAAAGLGLVVYLAMWALLAVEPERTRAADFSPARPRADLASFAALGAIGLGANTLAARLGLSLPTELLWPLLATAAGVALVWPRFGDTLTRDRDSRLLDDGPRALGRSALDMFGSSRSSLIRVAVGAVLVLIGVSAFSLGDPSVSALRSTLLALVIVGIGGALIIGPWIVRLSADLSTERSARVRSEAQEEFAAHLHDSVLQTLAIIQRRADDPRQVVSLARRQERELRAWLYEGTDTAAPADRLAIALETAAEDVEAMHHVAISVVCVGDAGVDDRVAALVAAAKEAMVNAAKHSGDTKIDVFAEVSESEIEVFVRDRGNGFDIDMVASDRKGIANSITARIGRAGGSSRIRTAVGQGTEVELRISRAEGVLT